MFKTTALSLALLGSVVQSGLVHAQAQMQAQTQTPAFDTAPIEKATGIKGTLNQKENVYKVSKPRPNMNASIDGWKIPPFMGIGSWAAFTPTGNGQVMVMGDNVLFEDEVPATMRVALDNGLEVTALHNHFFYEQPRVFFMTSVAWATRRVWAQRSRKCWIRQMAFVLPTRRRQRNTQRNRCRLKTILLALRSRPSWEAKAKRTTGCSRSRWDVTQKCMA